MVIFINQIREKVGVMYGNPETTTGGRALKFYATIRLEIRRAEPIKSGSDIVGNTAKIKVVKNKVAPPFRSCTIEIVYGEGISKFGEIIDIAESKGILRKAGNWYSYNDEKIGNGRDAAKRFLIEHPEIADEIEAAIRDQGEIPSDAD